MTRHRSSKIALALALAAVTLTAACSSSGSNKPTQPAGSSSGQANQPPFIVGAVAEESGAYASANSKYPLIGAQVAADYINAELGGFGGRKVEVVGCDTQSSAAGALTCANKFVAAHVDLVLGISAFWGSNGLPVISKSHIINQTAAVQQSEVTDPWAFPIGGGIFTEYPAQSFYALQNLKASNGVAIVSDTGASQSATDLYAGPWKAAGKQFHSVLVPPTSADLSPSVAKALSFHPDAIMVTLAPSQAILLYEALAQQGFDMSHVVNQGPTTDQSNFFDKVTPTSAVNGTVYSSQYLSYDDTADPAVKLYRHAMQTYGHTDGRAGFYLFGFAPLLTDYLIAKEIGFDKATPTTLKSAFETKTIPIFMSYQYDRSTAPQSLPQVGASYFRFVKYDNSTLSNTSSTFLDGLTGKDVTSGPSPFASFPGA
jgi:branched-chain amino acid transport system substrate-binding protein